MGKDICHKYDRKVTRRRPKSNEIYLRILVKLYRFLAQRTKKKFNRIILRRLCLSRKNRPACTLRRVIKMMKHPTRHDMIAVCVAHVINDVRVYKVPKLTVCALKFSDQARARIIKAGGTVMTLDQLAIKSPTGKNTVLFQGRRKARKEYKHFGLKPGAKGSHTKPYVRTKGRKFEKARGRRRSRGFKK